MVCFVRKRCVLKWPRNVYIFLMRGRDGTKKYEFHWLLRVNVIKNHVLISAKLHAESPPPLQENCFSSRNWFGYNYVWGVKWGDTLLSRNYRSEWSRGLSRCHECYLGRGKTVWGCAMKHHATCQAVTETWTYNTQKILCCLDMQCDE
jgi:hypothetical protein